MMRVLALLIVLSSPAAAVIPWGSGINTSAGGGGATDGQDINADDGVFKTLRATDTAHGLTVDAASTFKGSATVDTNIWLKGNLALGASGGTAGPDFAIDMGPDATTSKRWGLYSNGSGGAFYGFGFHNSGYVEVYRNNDLVMNIGAGLVGIGSPSAGVAANAALEVNRTGGDILTATNGGATIMAVHAGSSMTVTGNAAVTGNLGIGTASPASKLSVVGDFALSGVGTTASSFTVRSADGLGVGSSGPISGSRVKVAGDYMIVGHPTNAATNRSAVRFTGAGYNSTPSASNAESDGDKWVYYNDPTGKVASGLGGTYDLWFQANGSASSRISFWTGSGTSVAEAVRIASTGGLRSYSRTIAQLLAITPLEVGEQFFCNNCSPAKIVVSTGTSAGNFADAIGGAFQ